MRRCRCPRGLPPANTALLLHRCPVSPCCCRRKRKRNKKKQYVPLMHNPLWNRLPASAAAVVADVQPLLEPLIVPRVRSCRGRPTGPAAPTAVRVLRCCRRPRLPGWRAPCVVMFAVACFSSLSGDPS